LRLSGTEAVRTKEALSQKTAKLMVFTLIQAATKKRLRLKGGNQLPKVMAQFALAMHMV